MNAVDRKSSLPGAKPQLKRSSQMGSYWDGIAGRRHSFATCLNGQSQIKIVRAAPADRLGVRDASIYSWLKRRVQDKESGKDSGIPGLAAG